MFVSHKHTHTFKHTTGMGDDVALMVNYPHKSESRSPGSVSFDIDSSPDKVGGKGGLVMMPCVWRCGMWFVFAQHSAVNYSSQLTLLVLVSGDPALPSCISHIWPTANCHTIHVCVVCVAADVAGGRPACTVQCVARQDHICDAD